MYISPLFLCPHPCTLFFVKIGVIAQHATPKWNINESYQTLLVWNSTGEQLWHKNSSPDKLLGHSLLHPFKTLCSADLKKQFSNDKVPKLRVVQRKSKNVSTSLGYKHIESSPVLLSCGLQTSTCPMSGLGNCKLNILSSCAKPNIHPFPCLPFELLLSVWKQTFPPNVKLCWARFSLNPSRAPDGKVQVHVWKWWPHLLLNLNFISCNCLLFHGLLRFQPVGKCRVLQKQ